MNAHDQLSHLTTSSLAENSLTNATWEVIDSTILVRMVQSLEISLIQGVVNISLIHHLWATIKTLYTNKTHISETIVIFEPLFNYKQGDISLQQYFIKFHAIIENLFFY